jgi:glutathione S-transferase
MRLYHLPGARSTRVLWTLEEIGKPYDLTVMTGPERRSDAHLLRHPLGRVPVIELDDGQYLFESAAICLQLADLNPEARLIPALASTARGLVYQWTMFAMTELEPKVFGWIFAKRRGEDETAHAAAFAPVAYALREHLAGQTWVAGDGFTVADIFCASMLGNAFRRELLDEAGPLRSYVDRAFGRPAYLRAQAVDE